MGVYQNDHPQMILGNETIGGANAKLGIVACNAFQSVYVLQDKAFNLGLVPYLKCVEG